MRTPRFLSDESGIAAIEFALIGPTLLAMLLACIDLSGVLAQREAMDHVLRAGAQSAMADAGAATVLTAMQGTASASFSTDPASAAAITLAATRFCACPNSPAASLSCGTICTGNLPTLIFYRMTASKPYSGILFPHFTISPALQVQVR